MIAFLLKYWQTSLAIIVFGVSVGMCRARDQALRNEGEAMALVHRADSTIKVLRVAQAQINTKYIHDTIRFTKWRDSIQTLTQTVTEWKHDTLKVVEYVQRTDSALRACSDVMQSCDLKVRNLEDQLVQERSKQPAITVVAKSCTVSNVGWSLLAATGGYFGGKAAHK